MKDIPVSLIVAAASFILLMFLGPDSILFYHLATAFAVSMFTLLLTGIQSYFKTKGEHQNEKF